MKLHGVVFGHNPVRVYHELENVITYKCENCPKVFWRQLLTYEELLLLT